MDSSFVNISTVDSAIIVGGLSILEAVGTTAGPHPTDPSTLSIDSKFNAPPRTADEQQALAWSNTRALNQAPSVASNASGPNNADILPHLRSLSGSSSHRSADPPEASTPALRHHHGHSPIRRPPSRSSSSRSHRSLPSPSRPDPEGAKADAHGGIGHPRYIYHHGGSATPSSFSDISSSKDGGPPNNLSWLGGNTTTAFAATFAAPPRNSGERLQVSAVGDDVGVPLRSPASLGVVPDAFCWPVGHLAT